MPASPNPERPWPALWRLLRSWAPQPLPKPQLDPELEHRSGLERAAEILRYRLLRLEYALSPNGVLREWTKLALRFGLLFGIPALLAVPAVVVLFHGLSDLTALVALICANVLKALVAMVGIILLGWILVYFVGHWKQR